MDDFKRQQHRLCGPGGPKCECCNMWYRKDRKKLNRLARTRLKRKLKQLEVNEK